MWWTGEGEYTEWLRRSWLEIDWPNERYGRWCVPVTWKMWGVEISCISSVLRGGPRRVFRGVTQQRFAMHLRRRSQGAREPGGQEEEEFKEWIRFYFACWIGVVPQNPLRWREWNTSVALAALYSSVTVSTTTDGASLCLAFRIGRQTWFARVFRPIWTNVEKAGKLFPRCWCWCMYNVTCGGCVYEVCLFWERWRRICCYY